MKVSPNLRKKIGRERTHASDIGRLLSNWLVCEKGGGGWKADPRPLSRAQVPIAERNNGHLIAEQGKEPRMVLFVEREPNYSGWRELCASHDVQLLWPDLIDDLKLS